VLALGLLGAAAGCSGGSPSHQAAGGSPAASTAAAGRQPVDAGAAAPASATAAASTPAAASDADFCADRAIANPAADFDNPDPAADIASLQKAVALAPSEIKPDVQTIADVDIPIFQGKVPPDQIDQRVGDPKVLAALRHIAAWSAAHCH
jgi:hypothetical protein